MLHRLSSRRRTHLARRAASLSSWSACRPASTALGSPRGSSEASSRSASRAHGSVVIELLASIRTRQGSRPYGVPGASPVRWRRLPSQAPTPAREATRGSPTSRPSRATLDSRERHRFSHRAPWSCGPDPRTAAALPRRTGRGPLTQAPKPCHLDKPHSISGVLLAHRWAHRLTLVLHLFDRGGCGDGVEEAA